MTPEGERSSDDYRRLRGPLLERLSQPLELRSGGPVETICRRGDDRSNRRGDAVAVRPRRLDERRQRRPHRRRERQRRKPSLGTRRSLGADLRSETAMRMRVMGEPRREIGRQRNFSFATDRRASRE